MTETPSHSNSQSESSGTSTDAEKKLWLDFLAKLNDRELQKERSSGATTWIILAVAAATLYQFIQQIPRLLEVKLPWYTVGTIVALEIDFLVHFGIFVYILYLYAKGSVERRIFPELKIRATRVIAIVIVLTKAFLVVLHGVLAEVGVLPSFVLWSMRLFGLYWLLDVGFSFRKYIRTYRMARRYGVKVPLTTLEMERLGTGLGSVIGAFVLTPFFSFAGASLFVYIRQLIIVSPGTWIVSFNTATQLVVAFFLLFFVLGRTLYALSRNVYLELERDTVLENLPLEEIRRRFTLEVLGPRVSDWLK
jgi:hypothetical protein